MKVLSWPEFLEAGQGDMPLYGTIGVFDGVHLGHKRLLSRLVGEASGKGASVAITFLDNPKRLLRPSEYLGDLTSREQKLEKIAETDIDLAVLIDYTPEFGSLSGQSFLRLIRERTALRHLVMGENSRIGAGASMSSPQAIECARSLGMEGEIVPSLVLNGRGISSSRIRAAVMDARFEEAAACLGYRFELDLRRWSIEEREGSLLYSPPESPQILPKPGSYPVESFSEGGHDSAAVMARAEGHAGFSLDMADGLPRRLRFV